MKIVVAKMSGFCMGVRRAVEMVLDAPERHPGPICTFGPLIHNPQVLDLLTSKQIAVLRDIPEQGRGTVLVRAHGVPPETKKRLKGCGFNVIDATCPRVIRVQSIIRKHARQDYAVIIVGDKDHPEVVGLLGYAGRNGHVVDGLEELERLPAFERAIVVAQTTQHTGLYRAVKEWIARRHPHYKVFETICDSTERRQEEVRRLAEAVDAVVVVGGRESGNTQRLFEIARQAGKPAFLVESEADLAQIDLGALAHVETIGITAGASTPNWVIRKVYMTLESMVFRRRSGWHKAVHTFLKASLLTNLYVSLGACGLCYAVSRLQGIGRVEPFVLIAFLYVQSMHILNHLTGGQADRYNEPERARFYQDRRVPLTVIAVASGAAGLVVAGLQGALPFAILLVMSLLGLSYRLPLVPAGLGTRFRRIKDIPGLEDAADRHGLGHRHGGSAADRPVPALRRGRGVRAALGRRAGLRAHGLFRHPRHAGRPPGRQGDDPDPARRTAFAQAAEDDSDPARARAGGLLPGGSGPCLGCDPGLEPARDGRRSCARMNTGPCCRV